MPSQPRNIQAANQDPSVAFEAAAIAFQAGQATEGQPASTPSFSMVAYTGAAMRFPAWPSPVVVDLAGIDMAHQQIPIRLQHDAGQGVGHTTRIAVVDGQLLAEGIISRDTPAARDVVASAAKGFPWQASIGARVDRYEIIKQGVSVTVNGQVHQGPVIVATRTTLGEISFVDIGADRKTSAKVAASGSDTQAGESTMFEKWLQAMGLDPATLTPEQTAKLQAKHTAEIEAAAVATAAGAPDVAAKMRADAAAESLRMAAVIKACDGNLEIQAKAIAENWTAEKAELEVLRAARPQAANIHVHGAPEATGSVLEASLCLSGKLDGVEKAFDAKTLEAASKHYRGIGIQELLLTAAWAAGYTGRTFRQGDLRNILQAAFSSAEISSILSNVANKFLLQSFSAVEGTWRAISAIRSVKDFKTVTSYRLTGAQQYIKVGPTGELKHGKLADESFTNKADTYGLLLSVTRQDIINDDLGALTVAPRALGRGAGLKLNDVFWTAFMDNAAFFAAGNRNYQSGATTNLSVDSLTALELLFLNQVDADSKPLGISPAILLVPNALNVTATSLMKSLEIRDTTASTKAPISNPHAGKFDVQRSSYLANTAYTGNSAKAWYLLANPADLATIEVAFLNGQESPTIEQSQADFDTLGIQMRGFHDFGVTKQDPRAGAKSKGEA